MSLGPQYRKLFAATTISNLGDGVGVVAYPWLASAITRSPLLIALVAVAQRLPWLFFTLPAGVITDRHDRRTLMVGANEVRAVLTFAVAAAVLARQGTIPAPDEVEQVVGTEWLLYVAVIVATLLLGVCEVLYDNSAQTFMPAIVGEVQSRAGGRRRGHEQRRRVLGCERGHRPDGLAADPQTLAARRQEAQPRAVAQQVFGHLGGRGDHVLAVVEHDEQLPVADPRRRAAGDR